jgi:hypothetical protein
MPRPDPTPPNALADRAADQLAFIRATMVRAGTFTAVSGAGMMLSGVIGTTAAVLTPLANGPEQQLALWLAAAAISIPSSLVAVARKAARSGQSLKAGPARTFALALAPALVVGALLTLVMVRSGEWDLLPGVWLCCYGAAVVSGGAFSVRAVPVLGTVLVALGAMALFLPSATHVWLLGLGFGLVHLFFGFFIARYHGG